MRGYISLVVFLAIVVGGGIAIGMMTAPGPWYETLAKPAFNPPNWIFAPVWTILYVLIAIAGWRTWKRDRSSTSMIVWYGQLVLNLLWAPLFFAFESIAAALLVIVVLLVLIVTFIVMRWRADRVAALLFFPYGAWVAFATALNVSIWLQN